MEQLLPQASRAMNGAESLLLEDTAPAPTEGSWGFSQAANGAAQTAGTAPTDAAVHRRNQDISAGQPSDEAYRSAILRSDKYRPISHVAGKRMELVAGPLLFGICATGYSVPLPHCPCGITLVLVPTDAEACVTDANGGALASVGAGNAATGGAPAIKGRHNRWEIVDPELVCSMITLNSAVTAAFDKEISSSGLVMECRSYGAVNQSILSATTDLAYHISRSNITDVFFGNGTRIHGCLYECCRRELS